MKTIALIFTNFGPYHIARVAAAAKLAEATKEFQVVGIELARQSSVYEWESDISQLRFPLHTIASNSRPSRELLAKLDEVAPDVLAISGYADPAMIAALRWCRRNDCTPVLMSESGETDFKRHWLKEWLKKRIVRQFHSALVGGKPHKRYLQKLGMKSSHIFTGYDVVNNATFSPSKIGDLPRPITARYFLTINRFIPKKNLGLLINAYASYREQTTQPWDLALCGDGELRTSLEEQIQSLNLGNHIQMPGFLQEKELLPYFANASAFIHASTTEQWGLVVNEAMAAGLPVIVSNRCGCFEDLLLEGVNGFGFDPTDADALRSLMHKMSSPDTNLKAMGNTSLEHIANFGPDAFAKGLLEASSLT